MSHRALSPTATRSAIWALTLSLLLFAAFAAAGASRASACVSQPFSPTPLANSFEGADGDQCDSDGLGSKRDWQNVVGQDGFVSTVDAPSATDTIYGPNNAGIVGGSSDENVPDSWNFTIGNLGAAKYDALAAYSFTDPLNDKLFVDLAFIRAAASGATFLAFELNQQQPGYRQDANEADATKPFAVPTRSRGDLLVTYDVSNAGAIALGLCIWDGDLHSGRWEAFAQDLSGAPITNQPCPAISTTLYQAALNDALGGRQGDIPAAENYLGTGQIDQGRFGEAVVNLTDALKDPSNPTGPQPCIDFGYVWMHTRSSDSLTSNQQDFILPQNAVSIANCSVGGRKFEDANGNGANDGTAAGEPYLGGWTMFVDYNGNGVLDNNKDATFVNDMDGVVEAGEEEPYAVTSDGTDGQLLGHYEITQVQSGTWPVREVLKSAWDCTAAIGGGAVAGCPERTDTDPDTALGFQLTWANNEAYSGRDFGNRRQPATLRVIKHVTTDDGGTAVPANWSLHVTSGGNDVAGSPQPGSDTGDVYTLTAGQSYTVGETGGPSGYAATFSGDCAADGTVTVAAGTEKTCTITNDDVAPTIKVVKHVVTDDGGTAEAKDWSLHLRSGATDVTGSPKAGSESGDTYTVAAGAYSVGETGGPSGYAATFSGDCAADGTVSVTVGQTKTCTITNDDIAPRVKVVKHVINDDGGSSLAPAFTLTVDDPGSNPAGVAGDESGTFVTVDPGAYTVSETGPSGYAASYSADCDASVAIGETKTCTVTNDDIAPRVKVVKHVINDDGGSSLAPAFTLTVDDPGSNPAGVAGDESGTFVTVDPGAYTVSETGPSGYAASYSADCDASVAIGETKTCTVTNDDIAPRVKVVKHVINDDGGSSLAPAFTLTVDDPGSNPAGVAGDESGTFVTVDPGAYTVSETGPSGYAASYSADCDASVAIGETKTCTVTNDDIAPTITVVKHVINDDGGTAGAGAWSLHLRSGATDVAGSPKAGSETGDTYTVAAGDYSVDETGGPSGYAASFGDDCGRGGDVSVAIGETKTCTITNDDIAPTITVVKHVVNDDGGTSEAKDFTLTVDDPGTDPAGVAGNEAGTDVTVDPGAYKVSETGPSGYAASYSADCDASVAIGETKTCTVTNDDIAPTITVIKHVVNDNGGSAEAKDWSLHLTSAGTDVAGSPQAGTETGDTYTVAAGTYGVSESGGPSGYAQSFSGSCNSDGNITVTVGQTRTCTITNDDAAAQITVVKHVVTDDGGSAEAKDWSLHLTSAGTDVAGSPQAGTETGDTYTVPAGSYNVGETGGPSGYAASYSGACDAQGDITVGVGQTRTCTITNDDIAPTVKVIKHVVNDNGGTAEAKDWSLHLTSAGTDVAGSPQAGTETGDTYTVAAGTYGVSESGGPSGYAQSFSGSCNSDGNITVTVGQTRTCTITNDDIAPTITVVKHVVNDNGGTAEAKDWSLHLEVSGGQGDVAGSPQAGSETGDTYTVAAGTYDVSESGGPAGYAASFSGSCNEQGDITVAVGQAKTCTITNDDIAPRLTVIKHVVNKGGSAAQASDFQMDVRAAGASVPHFPGDEQGRTITLDAGTYSVDESGGPSTFAKELSADCAGTIAVGTEKTCTITNTKVLPGGVVVKRGPAYAYHGDQLTFTFEVTNPGTTPLTTVTVTDDKCAPVVGPTQKLGGNQDDLLDATETWVYTCTMGVPAHAQGDTSLVNVVTLAATDADGEPVGDTDQHTTRILHPAIAIDKTGPATAQAGTAVDYALVVTNPGDVPFLAANVNVGDALCEAPPVLVTNNGDATPGQLDPGDSWGYMCRVRTLVGQTQIENVGVVTAIDSFAGHEVTASDPATTVLTAPLSISPSPPPAAVAPPQSSVLAATAQSGTARLTGPARCVTRAFTVKVTGSGIAKVKFTLDGRTLKTVKAIAGRTVFGVRINPRGQGTKPHRVTARVTFKASADTKARTLRYVYLGCPKQAVAPQFTG